MGKYDLILPSAQVRNDSNMFYSIDWTTANANLNVLNNLVNANDMSYGSTSKTIQAGTKVVNIPFATVSDGYDFGVLAPNGNIYFVPNAATQVAEFNPYTKQIKLIGDTLSSISGKWRGGCLAPDGNIYCVPANASQILKINPNSKKAGVIGTSIANWYKGAFLAPNGLIYGGVGQTSTPHILEFNYITQKFSEISITSTTTNDFGRGVIAPNGNLYMPPQDNDIVLEFNLLTKKSKVYSVPDGGGSNTKYSGGVLARDGRMYCIPSTATYVLVFDTISKKSWLMNRYNLTSSTLKWAGGVLAPDGCIYGVPNSQKEILKIDPLNQHITKFATLSVAIQKYYRGVMHPNGNMYFITGRSDDILEVQLGLPIINSDILCERTINCK